MGFLLKSLMLVLISHGVAAEQPQYLDARDVRISKKIGQCSVNGYNKIGRYNVEEFDYKEIVEWIRSQDKEVNSQHKNCGVNRVYSSGTNQAVRRLEQFLDFEIPDPMEDYNEATRECFENSDLVEDIPDFKGFADLADNEAIVSSSFLVQDDDWEHGESCAYWDFYFFRKDGFFFKWAFDYSL